MLLVRRRTPATVDDELNTVVRGISRSSAQGTAQIWIEPGYTRNLVVEDGRAVGNGTAGLAKRITLLVAGAVEGIGGRRGRRHLGGRRHRGGRPHERLRAESCGDRHDGDEHAGGATPA